MKIVCAWCSKDKNENASHTICEKCREQFDKELKEYEKANKDKKRKK